MTEYQAFDVPTTDYPSGVTQFAGADTSATEIHRDIFGKPQRIRKRNASGSLFVDRSYVYDIYQRLCKSIEPETGSTVLGYDSADNLTWSASGLTGGGYASLTDCSHGDAWSSGRRVDRSYNNMNRLTSLAFPDGRGNQSWTYELDGLPQTITTNNVSGGDQVINRYFYNKRRLMRVEQSEQPGWYNWQLETVFDGNASVAQQRYPTGLEISFAPNALGQPTEARDQSTYAYASGASYYPNGALKQFTYGNGIVHSMSQNARQLPQRVLSNGGVVDLSYFYDPNGNVSVIADETPGRSNGTYSRWLHYDGLDRLTDAGSCMFGGDCWHRFTYDALDNMKSWKLPGVKDYAEYVYDVQNRLGNIKNSGGATVVGFGYDAQGNLQNKNGQMYSFDFGNRLREVTGKEYFRYDGQGHRVLAWSPATGSVLSQYSLGGQVLYQQDDRRAIASENIYFAGSLIALRERAYSGSTYNVKYQHTDALGSPVAVTNAAGAVIERNDYEPYGTIIGKPNYQGFGFTGHLQDSETGLTYMQQRYYDPTVGRFLSVDPVTALSNPVGMFNRYKYAANNPYRFVDPDGRYECEAKSKAQCARVDKAVSMIHKAAEGAPKDSRIAQVSAMLGQKGDKGVVISGNLNDPKNLGEAKVENGVVKIGLNFDALKDGARLGSVTMHEGSHGVDQKDRRLAEGFAVWSRTTFNISELNAGKAQADMFKALGMNEPYGLYSTKTGVNWDAINKQADRSVEQICAPPVQCAK